MLFVQLYIVLIENTYKNPCIGGGIPGEYRHGIGMQQLYDLKGDCASEMPECLQRLLNEIL